MTDAAEPVWIELDTVAGAPGGPGRGLAVAVHLDPADPPPFWDPADPELPALLARALARVVDAAAARGVHPPYTLWCVGRVMLDGLAVERLVLGSGGPEVEWPGDDLRVPLWPAAAPRFDRPGRGERPVEALPPEPPEPPAADDAPPPAAGDVPANAGGPPEGEGAPEPDRVLQCLVGPPARTAARDNILRAGANAVDLWLGPEVADGAGVLGVLTNEALGMDADHVAVDVQLSPLEPPGGPPALGVLFVPRSGPSPTLTLAWTLPPGTSRARAQLALDRGGRVIAVAELSGVVGEPVRFTPLLGLGPLDGVRPAAPGAAIIADADDSGRPVVVVPAESRVESMPGLAKIAEDLRLALSDAVHLTAADTPANRELQRTILVAAARAGRELFLELEALVPGLADAPRLQVVTARSPVALPLELLYLRPAPRGTAQLCPVWAAGGDCGPACGDPTRVVCPDAFFGVRRVVERHYVATEQGDARVAVAVPDPDRPALDLDGTLLAASELVRSVHLRAGDLAGIKRSRSWDALGRALREPGAGVLVLLPHTTPAPPTMEVSARSLGRPEIESRLVTSPEAAPGVVILFGCDTGGSLDDPLGFVPRFMQAGSAVVFSSLALLRASVAPVLAGRLLAALRDPGRRGQPVGRVLSDVRRDALRAGLAAALALTACGDAEWEV